MRTKNKPDGQTSPSFIEAARRAQIIEQAIETIADLGFTRASLAQIAQRASISKGVINYYFTSKDELLRQVIISIYTEATQAVAPQIAAQPTAAQRLQVYICSAVEYIGTHRTQMIALIEILTHYRGAHAQPLFPPTSQEVVLTDLEALLHKGQDAGEFRSFDRHVMAITIRRAIDAVPPLYAAHPNLNVPAYAQELVTLFERATRKEQS